MRCPICGLLGSDYFHIACHVLVYERMRGRGMPDAPRGPPVYFPTFREAAMIGGAAVDYDLTIFKDTRILVE